MNEALTLDEALDMIDYQRGVIADMAALNEPNITGFTKCESRILRCLQSANGGVVLYGGLMSAMCFDKHTEPEGGSIRVHITRIRAKLRHTDCALSAQIENCWGEGYRMLSYA